MKTHILKCWPEPFFAVMAGRKTCEFRKDDRGYEWGDILHLKLWFPSTQEFAGPDYEMKRWVSDVRRGGQFGIPEGYVMLSIQDVPLFAAKEADRK